MTDGGGGEGEPATRTSVEGAKRPAYESAERLAERLGEPTGHDPGMKRPSSTVAGAGLVMLRVVIGVLWLVDLAQHWKTYSQGGNASINGADMSSDVTIGALVIVLVFGGAVLLVVAVFALLIFRGSNLARVIVMIFSVSSIATSFAGWWWQGQQITLLTTLPSLGLDILVLLALSSRSAAAYARRTRRR